MHLVSVRKNLKTPAKRKRILLASVLKPVDEPRMFERMGQSLAANGYEVFILGASAVSDLEVEGINFIPHHKINRLSWRRIVAPFQILIRIIRIHPDLVVITTHELLLIALLYSLFSGNKVIYDVQENYWRNIRYTNAFPKGLRATLAILVRAKEWVAAPFLAQFILAEKGYRAEMPFTKNKSVIIENKCKIPADFIRTTGSQFIQMIFTGTLAESTGVFQAIALVKRLHDLEPKIRLTILGYCAQATVLAQIKNQISGSQFITLQGGREWVSHHSIMEAIASADFGILFYPRSVHTENKIPTKLYEYLACQLPILLQNHKPWVEQCAPYRAAVVIDFENPEVPIILNQLRTGGFYSTSPKGLTWQSEERHFISSLQKLL